MSKHTLSDFTSIPVGGEAIPPEGSDYARAIHLPRDENDSCPWVLLRGEGEGSDLTFVAPTYLVASGFTPADSLGMSFRPSGPGTGGEEVPVRVTVDFPAGEGVIAWALLTQVGDIVSTGEAMMELIRKGDASALYLAETAELDELDRAVARHPAGKARARSTRAADEEDQR